MEYGTPAKPNDEWFRYLTNTDYVRDGRVHHSAFAGSSGLTPPNSENSGWQHELSGDMRSLSKDPMQAGRAFVEKIRRDLVAKGRQPPAKLQFVGFVSAKAEKLRTSVSEIRTDVIHTPLDGRKSHADFVIYNTTESDLAHWRDWLSMKLQFNSASPTSPEEAGRTNR